MTPLEREAGVDWRFMVERNAAALKRVLVSLVAMAEPCVLFAGTPSGEPLPSAKSGANTPHGRPLGEWLRGITLPRHLRRAILRLLRPAEAAVRRLIVCAARDVTVDLGPPRPRNASVGLPIARGSNSTGIVLPRGFGSRQARGRRPVLTLPLVDPLHRFGRSRVRRLRGCVPRISVPGVTALSPVTPWYPPDPLDEVDATRLAERLHALDRALGDLPAQALRFARWRARRRRALAAGRRHRSSPLRPGRAYGILRKGSVRPPHLVDEVLRDVHFFAVEEIGRLDTS